MNDGAALSRDDTVDLIRYIVGQMMEEYEFSAGLPVSPEKSACGTGQGFLSYVESLTFEPAYEDWLTEVSDLIGVSRRDLLAGMVRQWILQGIQHQIKCASAKVGTAIL